MAPGEILTPLGKVRDLPHIKRQSREAEASFLIRLIKGSDGG
jgi:hypothetical protein